MAVAEGIDDIRLRLRSVRSPAANPAATGESPSIRARRRYRGPAEIVCAFSSIAFERAKLGGALQPAELDRAADAQARFERRDDKAVAARRSAAASHRRRSSAASCCSRARFPAGSGRRAAAPADATRRRPRSPACCATMVRPSAQLISDAAAFERHRRRPTSPAENARAACLGIAPDRLAEVASDQLTVFHPGTNVPLTNCGDRPGCNWPALRPRHAGSRCRNGPAPPSRAARRGIRPRSHRVRASRPRAACRACRNAPSAPSIPPRQVSSSRPARRGSPQRPAAPARQKRKSHGSSVGR